MSLGHSGGLKTPIHAPHPAAFKSPMTKPKVGSPRVHPSAQVRLPRGEVNTSDADPMPFMPGVGKF